MSTGDNVLSIITEVQTGPLKSGMADAASTVQDSTAKMNASYQELVVQSLKAQDTQLRLKDSLEQLGNSARMGNVSAMKILTDSYRENIEESMKLAAVKKQITDALKAEALAAREAAEANKEEGEANEEVIPAEEAHTASLLKMRMAAQLGAREVGVVLPRGFASLMAQTPALQQALSAAFSVVAAVAFIQIAAQVGEALGRLMADTFIYTDAMKQMQANGVGANNAIAASVEKLKEETRELFTMQHTGTQNIQKDIDDNNKAIKDATTAYDLQKKAIVDLTTEGKKTAVITTGMDEAAKKTAALKNTTDDWMLSMNNAENSAGVLKAQIEQLGEHAKVLDEKMKMEKTKEAQAAAKKGMKDLGSEWELEFLKMREAEGQYGEVSTKQELAFWQSKLEAAQRFPALYMQVLSKIVALEKTAGRDEVADFEAGIREKITAEDTGSLKRIQLADQLVQYMAKTFGTESKEYQNALRLREEMQKQHDVKMKAAAKKALDDFIKDETDKVAGAAKTNEDQVQGAIQATNRLAKLHIISDKERVSREKILEDDLYKIQKKALQDKLALYKLDPDKNHDLIVRMQQDLEALEQTHQNKINAIVGSAVSKRAELMKAVGSTMNSDFNSSIRGMISGTESLGQAVSKMAEDIGMDFVNMGEKMVTDWITRQIAMRAMTGQSNADMVMSSAAVASAGTYASVSADPLLWESAAAFAADSYANVAAMAPLAFFKQGGINPRDQLAYLHKNEMVLPDDVTEKVLNGGGAPPIQVNMPVHALDSSSFEGYVDRHAQMLADRIKYHTRNGVR